MKISEAFDLYKNNYLLLKGISRRVLEDNDFVKNRLINSIGDKDISLLTIDDISKWVSDIQTRMLGNGHVVSRKQNTIRNDMTRLKMVLKYMKIREIDCINCDLIPIPKREDTTRPFLTSEEVARMINCAFSLRNQLVISLLYSSGIRLSEMIQLNVDDISGRKFTVIGKGKKARLCFMDKRTEKIMNDYLATRKDNCPALIVSYKNKDRMTPTNVQLLIKNSAIRAGITKKVSPHILRHSFATNFIQNNGSIRYLSTMLGHSNVSTTMVYTHIVDNDLEKQYKKYHTV